MCARVTALPEVRFREVTRPNYFGARSAWMRQHPMLFVFANSEPGHKLLVIPRERMRLAESGSWGVWCIRSAEAKEHARKLTHSRVGVSAGGRVERPRARGISVSDVVGGEEGVPLY